MLAISFEEAQYWELDPICNVYVYMHVYVYVYMYEVLTQESSASFCLKSGPALQTWIDKARQHHSDYGASTAVTAFFDPADHPLLLTR